MDLNSLGQKIDNWTAVVSDWQRKIGDVYFSPTPANVQVKLTDATGNPVETTIPNIAAFRQHLHNDVVAIQGRKIYIDEINGSDTNDGLDPRRPKKTVKNIIKENRHVRHIGIELLTDVHINSVNPIYLSDNGVCRFAGSGTLHINRSGAERPMVAYDGSRFEIGVSLNISQTFAPHLRGVVGVFDGSSVGIGYWGGENKSITIGNNVVAFDLNAAFFVTRSQNIALGQNSFLLNPISGSIVSYYGGTVNGVPMDATQARNIAFGIKRDANGVPRNIFSNYIL